MEPLHFLPCKTVFLTNILYQVGAEEDRGQPDEGAHQQARGKHQAPHGRKEKP